MQEIRKNKGQKSSQVVEGAEEREREQKKRKKEG